MRGKNAIHFLRKGLPYVAGAQAGLHMSYRNMQIKAGESATQCGGGVALHDHDGRPFGLEHAFESRENPRSRLEQRLARQHEVQIVMGFDVESLEHLVEHLAMLRRDQNADVEAGGMFAKTANHRTELDRLRPGAEDQQDYVHPRVCLSRG